MTEPDNPVLCYLKDGPKRGLVREKLVVMYLNSELTPANPYHEHQALICIC